MNSLDLCGPNPAPMSCLEIGALKNIVEQLPKNAIIIQIGAYIGLSTMAMLEQRQDLFIFSVDIKPHNTERFNLIQADLPANNVVRTLGDSSATGKHWPIKCNFLFIDGDHRYPAVKADLGIWIPKVKKSGLVAFHDYILPPYPTQSRVQIAVDEDMTDYEEIMFVDRLKVFRI